MDVNAIVDRRCPGELVEVNVKVEVTGLPLNPSQQIRSSENTIERRFVKDTYRKRIQGDITFCIRGYCNVRTSTLPLVRTELGHAIASVGTEPTNFIVGAGTAVIAVPPQLIKVVQTDTVEPPALYLKYSSAILEVEPVGVPLTPTEA